jgi:hypothetical protein
MIRCGMIVGFIFGVLGCGKGSSNVTGNVTLDEKPLVGALITFKPDQGTPGLGGTGKTDATGKFTLQSNQGGAIASGKYKVTISKRLNKDGSEPDPKTPPIESSAVETLLPRYSSARETILSAEISDSKRTADFKLQSATE